MRVHSRFEETRSMGDRKLPEQVKDEHVRVLGAHLGPVYYALYNQVAWLHAKWIQYRALFGHSPERVDLLNGVAPSLFHLIQDVLWKDVLLHIARLTDPAKSAGKDNLTLRLLAEESNVPAGVEKLVQKATLESAFVRDWRNRRLAHADLGLALGAGAEPLAEASRAGIERALFSIRAVLNHIWQHYNGTEIGFESIRAAGDANALIRFLQSGRPTETGDCR
jgi:hypothetical protein